MKRVVAAGDFHCGAHTGLTPPGYWTHGFEPLQREVWNWWENEARSLGRVHLFIGNADLIDGKGEASGGTEVFEADRNRQAEIAIACVSVWKAKNHLFTYGTSYHTGKSEDFEDAIAKHFDAPIGGHEWADVSGITFDVKHHCGSSSSPMGEATALLREKIWANLWSDLDMAHRGERFTYLLRSHAHFDLEVAKPSENWRAIRLPAMQAPGSKFGVRRCSRTVSMGFYEFLIHDDGRHECIPHILKVENAKPELRRY